MASSCFCPVRVFFEAKTFLAFLGLSASSSAACQCPRCPSQSCTPAPCQLLSREWEEPHAQTVPFTPVACTNANKPLSSLVAVQLRIILFYLCPIPVTVCKGSYGEWNNQERWVQGHTSKAWQLQKGRKEEGKAQVKGVRTQKGRTGSSLLCESS